MDLKPFVIDNKRLEGKRLKNFLLRHKEIILPIPFVFLSQERDILLPE
jgi:hypothetical protein